jgi:hypothetical protein
MGNVVYTGDLKKLEGHASYGDGGCVALVQRLTNVGHTSTWKRGPRVVDLRFLAPGTVIANFEPDGKGGFRFPNKKGSHAALFMEFGGRGVTSGRATSIVVVDQWIGQRVHSRPIRAYGDRPYQPGTGHRDSDNADQFYVVVK